MSAHAIFARPCAFLAALALLGACASAPASDGEAAGSAERGGDFASMHCSACHNVELEGASPNPRSPPFRTLRGRWNGASVQLRLARSPVHDRPDMPPRQLTRGQAADLAAFIEKLRDQSAVKPRFCIPVLWC